MPGPRAIAVTLSEQERTGLEALVRAGKTPQRIAFRARIILTLATGTRVMQTAKLLATRPETVRIWRRYWLDRRDEPVARRLEDVQRPGAPTTITPEQWCQIIAIACQPPERFGRPSTHWTARELADEAIAQQIVSTISPRHVGRFLGSGRVEATSKSILAQPRAR